MCSFVSPLDFVPLFLSPPFQSQPARHKTDRGPMGLLLLWGVLLPASGRKRKRRERRRSGPGGTRNSRSRSSAVFASVADKTPPERRRRRQSGKRCKVPILISGGNFREKKKGLLFNTALGESDMPSAAVRKSKHTHSCCSEDGAGFPCPDSSRRRTQI